MSLVNCFIPPPKHPITKGTTMILYCSCLSRNTNCWYFPSFFILSRGCSTHMDTPYRRCRLSSLICLLTSGWVASPCSLSSSDVPVPEMFISVPLDHSSFRPVFIPPFCVWWNYVIVDRPSDRQHLQCIVVS